MKKYSNASIVKKIKSELDMYIHQKFNGGVGLTEIYRKHDQSLITEVDLFVSDLILRTFKKDKNYQLFNFFSEENKSNFSYPCIILDPIDGTRELVSGRNECVVSLAVLEDSDLNKKNLNSWAWIYNPFSGFEIDSCSTFVAKKNIFDDAKYGMVSRSEWEKGLFKGLDNVQPRGSIAFKLGLLAAGSTDFVISKRPKNVWDIAAGSYLCYQRDIYCYSKNGQISQLNYERYEGPLLWCHKSDYLNLKHMLNEGI